MEVRHDAHVGPPDEEKQFAAAVQPRAERGLGSTRRAKPSRSASARRMPLRWFMLNAVVLAVRPVGLSLRQSGSPTRDQSTRVEPPVICPAVRILETVGAVPLCAFAK